MFKTNNKNYFEFNSISANTGLTRDINNLTQRYDSENDNNCGDPDTDATDESIKIQQQQQVITPPNKMQQSMHSGSSSGGGGGLAARSAATHSSFKRPTPVMGNRGLETRQSKRGTSAAGRNDANQPQPITVGALEVMNVKRVVNRYGTLPKVQRIGAFLDSLEDGSNANAAAASGVQNNSISTNGHASRPNVSSPATKQTPVNNVNNTTTPVPPQQMIRSNSSSGVTMQNNATASLNKLQRHRTTTDGSLMTFSSFRGGSNNSPKRTQQPALANLEFPPPPLDLPPPPEEFDQPSEVFNSSSAVAAQIPATLVTSSNDVSNTAPSVEEASSRFGVSLRKREPSTDSCSSLGSPPADTTAKSVANNNSSSNNNNAPDLKEKLMAEMKDRSKENANNQNGHMSGHLNSTVDPVSLLVTELAETMQMKQLQTPKATSSMGQSPKSPAAPETNANQLTNTFKAQLKKVEPKKLPTPTQKTENQSNIIDFKAHLRKVEKEPKKETNHESTASRKDETKKFATTQKTEIKIETTTNANINSSNQQPHLDAQQADNNASSSTEPNESNGKRRSTGSISSLKKLWEQPGGGAALPDYASTNTTNSHSQQLSPKFGLKTPSTTNNSRYQISPRSSLNASSSTSTSNHSTNYATNQSYLNLTHNTNKPPPAAPPPPPPSSLLPSRNHACSKTFTSLNSYTNSHSNSPFSSVNNTHNKTYVSSNPIFADRSVEKEGSPKTKAADDDSAVLAPSAMMSQSMFVESSSNNTSSATTNQLTQNIINSKLTNSIISTNSQQQQNSNTNKPAVPLKPTKLTIYATPIAKLGGSSAGNSQLDASSNSPSSTQISREGILELVGLLEGSLKHPVNAISASQWLQLSDKLNILQNSCVVFADNESMPPHSKFHFRELVTRVENQSQSLRTAGSKNVQDNERLVNEVGQSLRQISNALHR